jgi:hypothetical protein
MRNQYLGKLGIVSGNKLYFVRVVFTKKLYSILGGTAAFYLCTFFSVQALCTDTYVGYCKPLR